ncbi:MAG: SUMF1/EgtB/PvdO family nonheme iron enzyme [Chlorobium sp.]
MKKNDNLDWTMLTEYDRNVFINCPFDEDYLPFFDLILFTVYFCGFNPRCALEVDDAGKTRIENIIKIIKDCRFGIHDISRTELDNANKFPRFNMPFELGLFFCAQKFGLEDQKKKLLIVLDNQPYRYQKYISDISGQDIKSYNYQDYNTFIKCIRDVLNSYVDNNSLYASKVILEQYNLFVIKRERQIQMEGLDIDDLHYIDRMRLLKKCLNKSINDPLGSKYILVNRGRFQYYLTGELEDISGLYVSIFPVTNFCYQQFIDYLSNKHRFNENLDYTVFQNLILKIEINNREKVFYNYLQGDLNWANRFASPYINDDNYNRFNHPVVGVTWYGAKVYCYWLSCMETNGRNPDLYSLPKEIEWAYVAAGQQNRYYPWGSEILDNDRVNFNQESTTPVENYPQGATPEGLYDMVGNVWEWMDWSDDLKGKICLKGGAWDSNAKFFHTTDQFLQLPIYSANNIGFRVVRSSF